MVCIKRKVIQIANSTQLVSLPRKWSQQYGIEKGDELEIEARGDSLILLTGKAQPSENKEIVADDYGSLLPRAIMAMYKQGVDQIKVQLNNNEMLKVVQDAISKETVGYEIIDQREHSCTIKNVSGNLEDLDGVLRRTFLILINMSEEALECFRKKDFASLKQVAFLEESNNRFTTTCRRLLNKKPPNKYKYVGPLYYIIEEIENIADQYKYLCQVFGKLNSVQIHKHVLEIFSQTNGMLRKFYETYYKFSEAELQEIAKMRKSIVDKSIKLFQGKISKEDALVLHYQLTISQKIFCLTGPYLVLSL